MASSNVRVKSGYIVDLLTDPYNNTQYVRCVTSVVSGSIAALICKMGV